MAQNYNGCIIVFFLYLYKCVDKKNIYKFCLSFK